MPLTFYMPLTCVSLPFSVRAASAAQTYHGIFFVCAQPSLCHFCYVCWWLWCGCCRATSPHGCRASGCACAWRRVRLLSLLLSCSPLRRTRTARKASSAAHLRCGAFPAGAERSACAGGAFQRWLLVARWGMEPAGLRCRLTVLCHYSSLMDLPVLTCLCLPHYLSPAPTSTACPSSLSLCWISGVGLFPGCGRTHPKPQRRRSRCLFLALNAVWWALWKAVNSGRSAAACLFAPLWR